MMLEDIIGSSPVRTATKYLESLREYSLRLSKYFHIPYKKTKGRHSPSPITQ